MPSIVGATQLPDGNAITASGEVTDMQRTLFVHIGTHKTGTSSIQNFLRSHEMKMRECGIFVPKSGTLNAKSGHHNVAWEMRKDSRYDSRFGGIDQLVSELKTSTEPAAVISSEDFEYLVQYPSELKAFDQRIEAAGFSTRYIVYFRDRDSYARSLYCELEIAGFVDDFVKFRESIEYLGYVRVNKDLYYEFRYDLFVRNWEAILGPKIHACSYDEAVHGTGLLPSFLMKIGASNDLVDESRIAPVVNTMFDKFQQLAHELAVVKNSRSWRVTAPLRRILSYCRRVSFRKTVTSSKQALSAESSSLHFAYNAIGADHSDGRAKDVPYRSQMPGVAEGSRERFAPGDTQASRRTQTSRAASPLGRTSVQKSANRLPQ
jgi:hypothetical protein